VPGLVTTEDAARLADVDVATIRQWRRRGHLQPAGRRGRSTLYRVEDVWEAEVQTHQRDRSGRAAR